MKIAIITGSSSGIGQEFARQLDRKGLDEIWLIARDEKRLEDTKLELNTNCRTFSMDLANPESYATFKMILREANPEIKYLVNAAGFGAYGLKVNLDTINKMIDVNIKAVVNLTYLSIPYMIHNGSHLINIASIAAYMPLYKFNIYSATKAFVLYFSNTLHQELKNSGIKVIAICPGWTNTRFMKTANVDTPIGKCYNAKVVVRRALFDNSLNRMESTYGVEYKAVKYALKILPKRTTMYIWKKIASAN